MKDPEDQFRTEPRKVRKRSASERRKNKIGIPSRVADNEQRTCKAPGCYSHRRGISAFCKRHQSARAQFGHVEGRKIDPAFYRPDRILVADFLKRYADHGAVKAALEWIREYYKWAAEGRLKTPGAYEVRRMWEFSVPPAEFLTVAIALTRYSMRQPNTLPADRRLSFAIAKELHRLIPAERTRDVQYGDRKRIVKYKRFGSLAMDDIGSTVRKTLATFIQNVIRAIEGEHNVGLKRREKLAEDFPVNKANLPRIPKTTLVARIRRGWTYERAISTPVPDDKRKGEKPERRKKPQRKEVMANETQEAPALPV